MEEEEERNSISLCDSMRMISTLLLARLTVVMWMRKESFEIDYLLDWLMS